MPPENINALPKGQKRRYLSFLFLLLFCGLAFAQTAENNLDLIIMTFPEPGWYMVSVPLVLADNTVSTLFPMATSAFAWDKGHYVQADTIGLRQGIFLFMPQPTTVTISGIAIKQFSGHFTPGWHMIGSVIDTVNFSNPQDTPDNSILLPAFYWNGFNSRYNPPITTLEQTFGHWIAVLQECDLLVKSASNTPFANSENRWQEKELYARLSSSPSFSLFRQDIEAATKLPHRSIYFINLRPERLARSSLHSKDLPSGRFLAGKQTNGKAHETFGRIRPDGIRLAPWTIPMTVSLANQGQDMIAFGTRTGATIGLDQGVELLNPPAPPTVFDAFFQITHPIFPNLTEDFRTDLITAATWNLFITDTHDSSGTITWDVSGFPTAQFPNSRLEIRRGNTVLADMLSVSSLNYTGDQALLIVLSSGVPDIAVNPDSLRFGDTAVGFSDTLNVMVNNEGSADLEVSSTTIAGLNAGEFSIVSGGAPFVLSPGSSRNLLVSFTPLSTGAKTAVLRIVSNDPDEGTVNVVLSGTGVVDTCRVAITSPGDGAFVCDNSVVVTGSFEVSGGKVPICTINGDTVSVSGSNFGGTAALTPGFNNLIATCTFVDGLGRRIVCSDTVMVFSDPTPAECTFDFSDPENITGVAIDDESGIAVIEPFNVNNRIVTIEPFNAGDKLVRFSSAKIDPNEPSSFILRITNLAGCTVECDPVFLRLDPAQSPSFTFTVPHTDRYFYVNNHGLRRIAVTLNQHKFELVADAHQREVEGRMYVMPSHGARTIDLAAFMTVGENNVTLICEGPANSTADVILADIKIDERSGVGEIIPQNFALLQNYPNPFNPSTTIRFSIPEQMTNGVLVQLRIYNTLGNLVRSLVDETMFPGQHVVEWDGRNAHGEEAASGIYVYQLVAGEYRITKRMTRLK